MGYNISAIAVNKNYEGHLEELLALLELDLMEEGEIDFETASSNWKDEDICDVYFCDKGTVFFLNEEWCMDPYILEEHNVLTFVLSESSMSFIMHYSEHDRVIRSIMESEGERMKDRGEKLPVEATSEDVSAIIWSQLNHVIGKRFTDIKPDERALRYVIQ